MDVERSVVVPDALDTAPRRRTRRIGLTALVFVGVCAIPSLVDQFWLGVITQSFVWMIATLSVVVLYRATNAVSLCQASLMGVAANAATWFSLEQGWPAEVALVVGAVAAVPVGMILVLPALRLRGIELTILTLLVAVAIETLVFSGGAPFRAGDFGLFLEDRDLFGVDVTQRNSAYFASLAVAGSTFGLVVLLLRGRVGRTWQAIQTGNAVAASAGISTLRYKVIGFAVAALIAGVAGSLLLAVQGSADGSSFNVVVSIRLVIVAMIGGISAPVSAITGGIVNSVGLQVPAEFGLDGDWLDLVLGVVVIAAILGRRRNTEEQTTHSDRSRAGGVRHANRLAVASLVVLVALALPWFERSAGSVAGWKMPVLFLVGPVVAGATGLVVARQLRNGGQVSAAVRVALGVLVVLMVLVLVRVAIGSGVFLGGSSVEPDSGGGRVERSWGLLVAAHGAVFAIVAALALLIGGSSHAALDQPLDQPFDQPLNQREQT